MFNELPFVYDYDFKVSYLANPKALRYCLDKLLPDFIYDITQSEGVAYSLIDVATYIIDGITIGGHKISDETVVRNVANGWKYVISKSQSADHLELPDLITTLNTLEMVNLNDSAGQFRKYNIRVTGTKTWAPLSPLDLPEAFINELNFIQGINNLYEKSIVLFLWLCYRQFFEDGNKRTARLSCNYLLIRNRIGIMTIPRENWRKFANLLVTFYDTANATQIISFIDTYCMFRINGDEVISQIGGENYIDSTNEFD